MTALTLNRPACKNAINAGPWDAAVARAASDNKTDPVFTGKWGVK